ncbi:5'-3' exoribonuclease 1 [Mitosporidium daphniae]
MGVPKLFKWLKDRYPLISQSGLGASLKSSGILPAIDDLFIDANSIIHSCTHPEYGSLPKSEAEMFYRIGKELDTMVAIVAPRRMFFVAVDGVAPRAKLNQQRSRRFRAAAEAATSAGAAATTSTANGDALIAEKFDPNSITPGTPFMARLSAFLRSFLQSRLKEELYPPKVVYSGQEIPGEGEHKIMDEIRSLTSQKTLGPICIHGLDADLIMLSLASHHRQLVLLREQRPFLQRYGSSLKKERPMPESLGEMTFDVLHISILRDYLRLEFSCSAETQNLNEEEEKKVASDFVVLAMLAGNDFVPHLPGFHIDKGSPSSLLDVYKSVRKPDEYLTSLESSPHISSINWGLLARILTSSGQASPSSSPPIKAVRENSQHEAAETFMDNAVALKADSSGEEDCADGYKNYYSQKLSLTDERALEPLFLSYVRILLWAWIYYYRGLDSWAVFYPYHYAPLGGDIGAWLEKGGPLAHDMLVPAQLWGISNGTPLRPLEQLLAVLPIASGATLLPQPLFDLMSSEALAEWYPLTFAIDVNEKTRSWEHIVLIPFIDEKKLLSAVRGVENKLTPQEKAFNRQYSQPFIWNKGINHPAARCCDPSLWPSLFVKNTVFSGSTWGRMSPRRLSPSLQLCLCGAFSLEDGGQYCIQCLLNQIKKGSLFSNWPYHLHPLSLAPMNETHLRVFGLTDGKEIFYDSDGVRRRDLSMAELDLFSLARRVFNMKSTKIASAFSNDIDPGLYFFGRVERGNNDAQGSRNLSVNGVVMRTGKDFFIIPPALCVNLKTPSCAHVNYIWKKEKTSGTNPSNKLPTASSNPYDYFVKSSTAPNGPNTTPVKMIPEVEENPHIKQHDRKARSPEYKLTRKAVNASDLEAKLLGLSMQGPRETPPPRQPRKDKKDYLCENLKTALGISSCKRNHK